MLRRRTQNRQLQLDPMRWGRPREPAWMHSGAAGLLLAALVLAVGRGFTLACGAKPMSDPTVTDRQKFMIAHAHLLVALDRLKDVDKMLPEDWAMLERDIATVSNIAEKCYHMSLQRDWPSSAIAK